MSKRDYYSRQTILKEVGEEGQLKISNSKVLIIGAGGLGHPAATYLASAGFGEIAILDFDKVEESNLNRQVCFTLEDLGKYKAEILGLQIKKQNPYIKVSSIVEKLTPINVNKIMNHFDMVIDCCDNFATKYLLHDAAWFLKKDLVQVSIYQYEGQVQVFNYLKKPELGCLRCLWPKVPEKNCTGTCEQAGVIGATAGVMGSIQAMEAIKMTLGLGSTQQNTTTLVDLLNFNTSKIQWKKNEKCPLCSTIASIKSVLNEDYEIKKVFEVEGLSHPDMEIIDIREVEELSKEKSHNTYISKPLSLLEEWKSDLVEDKKYLFVCSKGLRSFRLVENLREENYYNCYSLFGGLEANLN